MQLLVLFLAAISLISTQETTFVQNLNKRCFQCLCYAATACNRTLGCENGYCGPFKISRVYWIDAGQVTLPQDEKERAGAYEDCAISYDCAQRIITNYLIKFGRDCNNDGITNCDDYSKINFNGGNLCQQSLSRNKFGQRWLERFRTCYPETKL